MLLKGLSKMKHLERIKEFMIDRRSDTRRNNLGLQ